MSDKTILTVLYTLFICIISYVIVNNLPEEATPPPCVNATQCELPEEFLNQ